MNIIFLYYIRCIAAVVIGGLLRNYLGKHPKAWLAWAVPGFIGLLLKFCLVELSIAGLASLFLYMAAGGLIASLVLKFRPEENPTAVNSSSTDTTGDSGEEETEN